MQYFLLVFCNLSFNTVQLLFISKVIDDLEISEMISNLRYVNLRSILKLSPEKELFMPVFF